MPQDKIPVLNSISREHEHGIVLVSTLVLLLLFAATTSLVQIKLFGNVHIVARLTQKSEGKLAKSAVHELVRPLIAEAIINFETDTQLYLDGTPYDVSYANRSFRVSVQDIDGLISPLFTRADIVRELLPPDLGENVLSIREKGRMLQPVQMWFGPVRINRIEVKEPHLWITNKSTNVTPNGATLSYLYNLGEFAMVRRLARRQPDRVVVHIEVLR